MLALFGACNGAICFTRIDEPLGPFSPLYRTTISSSRSNREDIVNMK
jgi:hypothetical protein